MNVVFYDLGVENNLVCCLVFTKKLKLSKDAKVSFNGTNGRTDRGHREL